MAITRVAFLDRFHPAIYAAIEGALPEDWHTAFADSRDFADQAAALARAEAAIVVAAPMGAELLAEAPRLRLIQKLGAGVDRIAIDECARRGIAVARLQGGNAIPVAEHTVMLMLAALRRLPQVDRRTRAGEWLKEEARGTHRQLFGKRVGLIGFGAIGRAVAAKLKGFSVEIVYHDPDVPAEAADPALGARPLPLDELIATADIVSLHCPLLPETAGLIDARRIAAMKSDAVLVNCARGGLVDEAALADALKAGRLLAAAIDTFAEEPPTGNPLLALEQTVITSHMAGATLDNFAAVLARGLANAARYLEGGGLPAEDAVILPSAGAGRAAAPGGA